MTWDGGITVFQRKYHPNLQAYVAGILLHAGDSSSVHKTPVNETVFDCCGSQGRLDMRPDCQHQIEGKD